MGDKQSVPCPKNPHQKRVFQCMSPYCGDTALICQGHKCAYRSISNPKNWICRKCYTAEYCESSRATTQEMANERIEFEH